MFSILEVFGVKTVRVLNLHIHELFVTFGFHN